MAWNYLWLILMRKKDVSTISSRNTLLVDYTTRRNTNPDLLVRVKGGYPWHLHHLGHGQSRKETFYSSSSFSACRCFKTEAAGSPEAAFITMAHVSCHSVSGAPFRPTAEQHWTHSTRTSAISGQMSVSNCTDGNSFPQLFNPPQHFLATRSFILWKMIAYQLLSPGHDFPSGREAKLLSSMSTGSAVVEWLPWKSVCLVSLCLSCPIAPEKYFLLFLPSLKQHVIHMACPFSR